jgi:hypothetical protein
MTTLMQAHRQWSARAPDERFTSLLEMQAFKRRVREQSHSTVISSRNLAIGRPRTTSNGSSDPFDRVCKCYACPVMTVWSANGPITGEANAGEIQRPEAGRWYEQGRSQ